MKIVKHVNVLAILFASLLCFAGCAQSAKRIDSAGTETITTVGELDVQDALSAATTLSQSLLDSGHLGKGGKASIIAISSYVNNTSRQIDRDQVIKKIRVTLNKAGVAQTLTTIGSTGTDRGAEDAIAADRQKADRFLNDQQPVRPEYTLTFKILDTRARAGNVRQATYTFQMSLTDINTGVAVWEDETQITKQGKKASVGW